uniref:Transmembrane protein 154 n=1 Tax=Capra hircus TaxID=9925 RepID=A0A8C2PIH8_CAPHI
MRSGEGGFNSIYSVVFLSEKARRSGKPGLMAPVQQSSCFFPTLELRLFFNGYLKTGEEDTELSGDVPPGTEGLDEESEALSTLASVTTEPYITSINSTLVDEDTDQLEFILMVLIPVILLSLLLLSAILLVIYHKRKRNKQEPSSQGSQSVLQTHELGSENVKVPIFEEDTPSVMEIEMEELDKWMNSMNRNVTMNPETEWC